MNIFHVPIGHLGVFFGKFFVYLVLHTIKNYYIVFSYAGSALLRVGFL